MSNFEDETRMVNNTLFKNTYAARATNFARKSLPSFPCRILITQPRRAIFILHKIGSSRIIGVLFRDNSFRVVTTQSRKYEADNISARNVLSSPGKPQVF